MLRTHLRWTAMAVLALAAACSGGGDGRPDALGHDLADAADADHDALPPDSQGDPGTVDPAPEAGDTAAEVDAAADGDAPGDPGPEAVDTEGPPYARWVNPFIGTGSTLANVGSAFPGATAPFGLVKVGPDTKDETGVVGFQHCAGYRYEDPQILAFTHTHLHGTGVPDYGNIGVMPVADMTSDRTARWGLAAPFSHDGEIAEAGYYAVTVTDPHVRAEFTATTRCAHHRYTWLDGGATGVLALDPTTALVGGTSAGGRLDVDPDQAQVEGWTRNMGEFSRLYGGFPVHFTMRFDRPIAAFGTWLDGGLQEDRAQVQTDRDPANFGAWFRFDTSTDPVVEVQVCLSMVDPEGARSNRDAELPAWDFEVTRAASRAAWEAELSRIEVTGGSPDEKTNFYTALYHVLQMPTTWSDADGRYRAFDRDNPVPHRADGWTYYTDMSLWDTFRTQHPLLTLAWPERQRDMMRSLAMMIATGGHPPMWPMGPGDTDCMIGEHAATVVADTVLKGIVDFDVDELEAPGLDVLYAGLKATADGPLPEGGYGGRDCIEEYLDLGWCPSDATVYGSAAKTLEYAFNDFCLAELAKATDRVDDEARWRVRAGNWRNVWDPAEGFFHGRRSDGAFDEEFEPLNWSLGSGPFIEGNGWQWRWFVPHDEAGLRETFGGGDAFQDALAFFMEQSILDFEFLMPSGYYFQGNEPDIHAPFLAIRAGKPHLAQRWSRWILDTNYRNEPDGLVGNDDAGTLAAWYVFAAIGLFPWPCVPGYYVTAPIFDRALVHLPAGDLEIRADGASGRRDVFIQAATFDDADVNPLWVDHATLARGGTLGLGMATIEGMPPFQVPVGNRATR